jgi:drug/metabolite transporter (DMT)-like permease
MSKQKFTLPILALIVANILWGANTTFIKMAVISIPPEILLPLRFLFASLVLLPFAIRSWKPISLKDNLLLILASIFDISLSGLALNIGLSKTSAINAAVITLLEPLLLFILSVEFLKERMSIKTLAGIVLALIGSLIIIGKVWSVGSNNELTGNLLVLISVFCFVTSIIIAKPILKKISSYQATFMCIFPGIVPVALYSLTQLHTWHVTATTTKSWQGLILSALVILVANFLFYFALRYKQAKQAGIYLYLDPLATFIASWWLLSERPTAKFIAGATLVFAGIYIAEFSKVKQPRLDRTR